MNEIISIDKPAGWTSFDVVAKIRGIESKKEGKRVKVGHSGTLDPFATGLLIILIGEATKRQDSFMKLGKEYEATLRLGFVSTTGDPEGEITQTLNIEHKKPTQELIENTLKKFLGEIKQIPPAYSAIKIDGKRAYALARLGKKVAIEPRIITIHNIDVLGYKFPELIVSVACSSGTYIRTLAEDIGKELGCGAYLTALRRTKIGEFDISDALTLDDFETKAE